ncbi:Pectinesterase inhibitor domain, partial [Dillenia turbinata]
MSISKLSYFIIVYVYLSFFPSNQVCSSHEHESEPPGDDSMAWWCSTTPHPEPCKYFLGSSPHHFKPPKHKTEFREMLILVAMDRVFDAWQHARNLQPNTTSRRLKGAWNDCVSLHYDAIIQLNRTLHGLYRTKKNCTDFDAQTWLSAALTNLEVCRIGSMELNVSHFISPIFAYNGTQLVSNSLAINKGLMEVDSYFEEREGFPIWSTFISNSRSLSYMRLLYLPFVQ